MTRSCDQFFLQGSAAVTQNVKGGLIANPLLKNLV